MSLTLNACLLLPLRGDAKDLAELEKVLETEKIMGLFTEFPSNPLLQCPDLKRLTELARKHGFPVVVDDTIANFHNVDLLNGPHAADVTVTSLTKLFSGRGASAVSHSAYVAVRRRRIRLISMQPPPYMRPGMRECRGHGHSLNRRGRSPFCDTWQGT